MSPDPGRPRFACACFLCAPPCRQPTDRDRLIAELDRLGIAHNLHDRLVPPTTGNRLMFSTAQLAELATFNSMQAFETWKLQQAAATQPQSLEQQLAAERNAHGALQERFDSLNADYDRIQEQVAALNAQIEAMRTLHAVELGATRSEKEALEAELQSRPLMPPGVYLDGAQQLVTVPAAAPLSAEKAWVTGE